MTVFTNNIENLKVGSPVTWKNNKGQLITGTVFERVRRKSRPKYEGPCCINSKSKRETSFIATYKSNRYWVDISQIVFEAAKIQPAKPSLPKVETKIKKPLTDKVAITKTAFTQAAVSKTPKTNKEVRFIVPDVFKQTFDSLTAYRRPSTRL